MNHNTHTFQLLISPIAMLLFLMAPLAIHAQGQASKMDVYRKACLLMIDGMDHKDKYALYEAKAVFDSVSVETITPTCAEGADAQRPPTVLFCAEYADSLIKHNFINAHLDNISIMRNTDNADLMVFHRAVAPHAAVSYQMEGSDECELMVVAQRAGDLRVTVTDPVTGKQWGAKADAGGHILQLTWTLGSDDSTYLIRIENNGDEPVSFVVTLN